jgi:multiple sugar transport system permease protein
MKTRNSPTLVTILLVMGVLFIFPFAYMIGGALKSNDEALTKPARVLPSEFHFDNFAKVFTEGQIDIPIQTFNSIVVTFSVTFGQIIVAALAGYAFARIRFTGRPDLPALPGNVDRTFELIFVPCT